MKQSRSPSQAGSMHRKVSKTNGSAVNLTVHNNKSQHV